MKVAIVTGTGIYTFPGLLPEPLTVETPFGPAVYYATENPDLVFLPRHGLKHNTPPHRIHYRSNFWALHQLGCEAILSAYAVGSITRTVMPRQHAVLSDFLDRTNGRRATFFEGDDWGVGHADMGRPYCPLLNDALQAAATRRGLTAPEAVYACTNGPRFESAVEIRDLARQGADLVGMTGVPEVALARELGMHFAGMALSMNLAAGLEDELQMVHSLDAQRQSMLDIFVEVAATFTAAGSCNCCNAVEFLSPCFQPLPRSIRERLSSG
jgi:5'-methylthioadenosine phosphorylase